MDRLNYPHGHHLAEFEAWADPGLSLFPAVSGQSGNAACYPAKSNAAPSKPVPAAEQLGDYRCGTWLDEDLRLVGDEREALLRRTLAALYGSGLVAECRRKDHKANFKRRVECFLVNAFRAHYFRASGRIAYKRGNNDYRRKERWLSGSSMRATGDVMAAAGLLGKEEGFWSGPRSGFELGWSATFWIMPPLLKIGAECGVSHFTIGKPPVRASKLIRLRGDKDFDGKARNLHYDPTDETERWATDLDQYNRFAEGHEIDIHLDTKGEAQLVAAYNRKQAEYSRQPGITQPEYFDRHLVRIFNDGNSKPNFEHGGRLYGAWYQRIPKWLRPSLTINDNQTVELDYSGMSVRMIYHERGIDYVDDPYALPGPQAYAVKCGRSKDYYRRSIKRLVQAMLNNDDGDIEPEMVGLEESFSPRFTRVQIRDMILVRHEKIKDAFGTGIGKRLQRLDSDIALDLITRLMDDGRLCLPIHDGFVVDEANEGLLMHRMRVSYHQVLGYYPIIKHVQGGHLL